MTGTVVGARDYWQRHYAETFRFGLGTEEILAALARIPPVTRWYDLGSGSESLLWAIALRARHLTAVDVDTRRLDILREFAAAEQPRGVHSEALWLCGRDGSDAFATRCQSLGALLCADCLTGAPPAGLADASADLVTQFGLLGLCRDADQFTTCFAAMSRLAAPDGWLAGANWVAAGTTGRVTPTRDLYQHAAATAGVRLDLIREVASADPDFPAVWMYLGRSQA